MPDTPPAKGWPALLLTALALAGGAVWLFGQALVDATEYPDYSTLNAAPTGTRLLYDALSSILPTHRLFEHAALPPDAALFRIGVSRFRALDERDLAFVAGGARLIQTFEGVPPDRYDPDPDTNGWRVAAGLSITVLTNLSETARAGTEADALPWLSAAVFRIDPETPPNWQTRYTLDGHPVVVESRGFSGSVILATDSFFLSNEALAKTLGAALPAALVGSAGSVFFDETVHGLRDEHNVAWLLHRYRLHPVLAVLALLFLLTLWQQACPLLPREADRAAAPQTGLRMEDGFVSLLRRHLPARRVPRQLAELWRQANPRAAPELIAEMEQAVTRAEAARTPPEQTGRALHALARRNTRRPPHARHG